MSAATPRDLLTKTLTKSPQSGPISQALLDSGVRIETSIEPNSDQARRSA